MSTYITDSCTTYSLTHFSKEWSELSENIHKISQKISITTNRMQFEANLDQLNFDEMALKSKIKLLPDKESEIANCMMESMDKTLTVLDRALYTPTVNPKEEFCCLFMSSLQKGMAIGLMGVLAKNLMGTSTPQCPEIVNSTLPPPDEIVTIEDWKAYQEKIMEGLLACRHNGEETSAVDILEHLGNGEFGSAIRDAIESETIRDVVRDVLDTVGNEALKIND